MAKAAKAMAAKAMAARPCRTEEELTLLLHLLQQLHLVAPPPSPFCGVVITSDSEGGASGLCIVGVGDGHAGVGVEAFPPAGVAMAGAATTEEGE